MPWRGKIIGGSLGSFFGPMGAMAGAAAGHLFWDRKQKKLEVREKQKLLAYVAGALYHFAVSDGPYRADEERTIQMILAETNARLGHCLTQEELLPLVDAASGIQDVESRLILRVRGNPELMRRMLFWHLRVAVSDGFLTTPERRFLFSLPGQIGLPPPLAESIFRIFLPVSALHETGPDHLSARETLGVSVTATPEQVKKAYRKMSLKYHPDRHADLPPDIRELAAEKFNQITRAYDLLSSTTAPDAEKFSWGKHRPDGPLAQLSAGDTACCFICGKLARLPDPFDPFTTRCPVCQALLTFEKELAEHL